MNIADINNDHVSRLEAKLREIYSYADGKRFDVRDELRKMNYLEKVYAAFVARGVAEGATFEEYSRYLANIRERLKKLNEVKKDIEETHAAEIKNINLLIELFAGGV